ncbi:hypothetical protein ACQP0C_07830 [Nocardia sp. CA-129566]|uniref:hypothetical protein n=1 Tax=Nocardia sp. CA-129566 TaxID=3239976 RepID=UPI003D98DF1B
MNAIVIVSVVLVVIVTAAVVTRLLRPRTERTHLTVADLQARLQEEAERLLPDGPAADSDTEHAVSHDLGRSA